MHWTVHKKKSIAAGNIWVILVWWLLLLGITGGYTYLSEYDYIQRGQNVTVIVLQFVADSLSLRLDKDCTLILMQFDATARSPGVLWLRRRQCVDLATTRFCRDSMILLHTGPHPHGASHDRQIACWLLLLPPEGASDCCDMPWSHSVPTRQGREARFPCLLLLISAAANPSTARRIARSHNRIVARNPWRSTIGSTSWTDKISVARPMVYEAYCSIF